MYKESILNPFKMGKLGKLASAGILAGALVGCGETQADSNQGQSLTKLEALELRVTDLRAEVQGIISSNAEDMEGVTVDGVLEAPDRCWRIYSDDGAESCELVANQTNEVTAKYLTALQLELEASQQQITEIDTDIEASQNEDRKLAQAELTLQKENSELKEENADLEALLVGYSEAL